MACACPCFGDEADAEEKPNQMIQLDGLGMLRLDTQHVGQGSQGARSAKWFYFGETDNRLAVVNLLLCITCLMMWMLAISVAYPYICGANPSGKTNDLDPPNTTIDSNGNQRSDGKHSQRGEQSNAVAHKLDAGTLKELNEYKEKYENAMLHMKGQTTEKDTFKVILDDIGQAVDYKGDELAKLPEMIRESKKKTEKQLKEVKVLYRRKTEELNKKTDEYKDSDRSNQESIDKFKAELSSKEDLLNNYRYDHVFPKYFEHYNSQLFEKNVDLSKGMEEARKAMDGKRFNNPEDTVAYKKWLDDVHPEKYEEFLARTNAKSKDGDDSNENTGARNDEFAMNKSNDVDKQNVSGMNDDNQ
eukprot:968785_1